MNDMTYSKDGAPIIISIAGDLGSGKSLLTTALVERFGAERYSTGNAQRQIAEEMGITTLQLNQLAETDKSIDDKIDGVFKDLAKTKVNLVVDSRMAFHFLPMSFKVRLEVHPRVAASRIQRDTGRIGEAKHTGIDDIEMGILARKASERARFKTYYGVDIEDHAGYDLVVNTTGVSPQAVSALIIEAIERWAEGKPAVEPLWISPRQLFIDSGLAGSLVLQNVKDDVTLPKTGMWPREGIVAKRGAPCTSEAILQQLQGEHGFSIITTGLCPLIVQKGADLVSKALHSGQELVPVWVEAGGAAIPDETGRGIWEKTHGFRYLNV